MKKIKIEFFENVSEESQTWVDVHFDDKRVLRAGCLYSSINHMLGSNGFKKIFPCLIKEIIKIARESNARMARKIQI